MHAAASFAATEGEAFAERRPAFVGKKDIRRQAYSPAPDRRVSPVTAGRYRSPSPAAVGFFHP